MTASVDVSAGRGHLLDQRPERDALAERHPVELDVAVGPVAVGVDHLGRVAEVLLVDVLDRADDEGGVEPAGEVLELLALVVVLDSAVGVDDVLGPHREVEALGHVLAGGEVALEHEAHVGVDGPGALRAAALDERHAHGPARVLAARGDAGDADDEERCHQRDRRRAPSDARWRRRSPSRSRR